MRGTPANRTSELRVFYFWYLQSTPHIELISHVTGIRAETSWAGASVATATDEFE